MHRMHHTSLFMLHIRTAMVSITSAKLRSALTIIGVAIGIGLLTSLVALGRGTRSQIIGQIDGLGSNLVYVVSSKNFILSNFEAATLTSKDYSQVKNTQHVNDAAAVRYLAGEVHHQNRTADTNLIAATTANYKDIRQSRIARGDYFTVQDEAEKKQVAVIGPATELKLFKGKSGLGQNVVFDSKEYRVVGIFEPAVPGSELTIGGGFDDVLFIPLATYQASTRTSELLSVIIAQTNIQSGKEAFKNQLQSRVKESHFNDNFSVITNDDLLSASDSVVKVVTSLIAVIATVSIIVGGIGIINIMLISLGERTKEIGIRKTMGANQADIITQFLIESTMLSLLGGLVGLILSLAATQTLQHIYNIEPIYSVGLFLTSVCISLGCGILFGVYPAIKASRIRIIDTLR